MSVFKNILPNQIPETLKGRDELLILRERILQYVFIVSSILGTAGVIAGIINSIRQQETYLLIIYVVVYTLVLVFTLFRNIPYVMRAHLILSIFFILGTVGLLESGLSGDGRVFLLAFTVMTVVLLGFRQGIGAAGMSLAALILTGWAMSAQYYPTPPVEVMANSGNAMDWTSGTIIFFILVSISGISMSALLNSLSGSLTRRRSLTDELEMERASLQERVQNRTEELHRRTMQIEAASSIARDISLLNNTNELLNNAVNQIRAKFGFYHAGVFLADERNEYAILRAATGEAGRAMLQQGHRLRIGEIGIVGYVVSKGMARIALDVGEDASHFKNPFLPHTHSEMALPLKIGERTIGALDIQSMEEAAFSEDDVKVLQIIADQLAVAVERAQLVSELQRNVEELEVGYKQYTQEAWHAHLLRQHSKYSYHYHHHKVDTNAQQSDEAQAALDSGQIIIKQAPGAGRPATTVALPIRLRGQTLGVIDLRFESTTVPQDLVNLLETTTNRLALALENARLLEEIQNQAERERVVSEISSKVRASSDIDSILRTAAAELGRTLGVSEVMVQLRPER